MNLTLPGTNNLSSPQSVKLYLPIVSRPSFNSTCLSALHEKKALTLMDFRPCAALRSTYFRCLHPSNEDSPMDSTLDGRNNFCISEDAKQLFSKDFRPSLSLTETILLYLSAYASTIVIVLGSVHVLLGPPQMT